MPTKLQWLVLDLKRLGHLPDIHLMICSNLNFTGANFLEGGTHLHTRQGSYTRLSFLYWPGRSLSLPRDTVIPWGLDRTKDLPIYNSFQFRAQVMSRVPVWEGRNSVNFQTCLLLHNSTLSRHPRLNVIRISFNFLWFFSIIQLVAVFQFLIRCYLECVTDGFFSFTKNLSALPAGFPKCS